jgi:diguanylate cyclase (GGDEF)-like protein
VRFAVKSTIKVFESSHPLSLPRFARVALAATLFLGLGAMLYLRAGDAVLSAGRRIGFEPGQGTEGVLVLAVVPDQPAARAGLRPRDQILAVDGMRLRKLSDYALAAARFRRGLPASFLVRREGRLLSTRVVPGIEPDWPALSLTLLAGFGFLGIGLLILVRGAGDLRARLLMLFALAVALDLALPTNAIGSPRLATFALALSYLLTGLQMGLELHLASLIPERHAWLSRRPRAVLLFYGAGLSLGLLAALTYLGEELLERPPFPWTVHAAEALLLDLGVPVWSVAVVLLLGSQALRYPEPRGRHQAGLVLSGVLPWCLFAVATAILSGLGRMVPGWLQALEPVTLLSYPVAFLAAIFRYHLFDIELVVRRSLIYTALTSSLILVFYAALGAGGALFSTLVRGHDPVWTVAAATLLLGLLFAPLRRALHRLIDRRFFPERGALRRRLIALAGELPALGKLPLMGEHLVARLCEIFAARRATLFLAAPETGLLSCLATSQGDAGEAPLLPLADLAIAFLERVDKPIPAAQVTAKSAALAQLLAPLDPHLAVPLVHQDRLIGLLVVGRKREGRAYPAEEVELLNLLAHHVAAVFENARLFESATYESLTGLLRREVILEQLGRELERAQRYRRPLTIAMADLDHFKEVNDRYGHLAGDALLKRIAQVAAGGLRSTDWLGRYGGEEFLLILPETGMEGACGVAEKIRALVQKTSVPMEDGSLARVTISIGLAALEDLAGSGVGGPRVTARDLIEAADRSLYAAKNGGRNRVHPLMVA